MSLVRIIGTGALLCAFLTSVPLQTVEAREPSKAPEKPVEPPKPTAPVLPQATLPTMGGRSPFAVPPKYTSAVQSLVVKGVVRTAQFDGAIVQVADLDQPVVLRVGSRFKLDIDDQRYEFRVAQIKEKSVVFKGNNDKNYEVQVQ
jgi:hypothetical protein